MRPVNRWQRIDLSSKPHRKAPLCHVAPLIFYKFLNAPAIAVASVNSIRTHFTITSGYHSLFELLLNFFISSVVTLMFLISFRDFDVYAPKIFDHLTLTIRSIIIAIAAVFCYLIHLLPYKIVPHCLMFSSELLVPGAVDYGKFSTLSHRPSAQRTPSRSRQPAEQKIRNISRWHDPLSAASRACAISDAFISIVMTVGYIFKMIHIYITIPHFPWQFTAGS